MLVLHLLLRHGPPVFETPVSRAHVIILIVGVGPVFQRVLQERAHGWVGVQLVVFLLGQHHRLPLDVGLAVRGIRVVIPRFFGEKQDGLTALQSLLKRVWIFQRLGRVRPGPGLVLGPGLVIRLVLRLVLRLGHNSSSSSSSSSSRFFGCTPFLVASFASFFFAFVLGFHHHVHHAEHVRFRHVFLQCTQ